MLNLSDLGQRVGVDGKTIERWLSLLEKMFLVCRVRPWFRNNLKRLVRTPKLHFVDSALLAALAGTDAGAIARDRTRLGPLLECFVHAELQKTIALSGERTSLTHYRDKDQAEVDFVLERTPGRIVGIEVKASATVRPQDFRGLARLKEAAGDGFAMGILLHDGERMMSYGEQLAAAPISSLWL